jgi:hypothetical protein
MPTAPRPTRPRKTRRPTATRCWAPWRVVPVGLADTNARLWAHGNAAAAPPPGAVSTRCLGRLRDVTVVRRAYRSCPTARDLQCVPRTMLIGPTKGRWSQQMADTHRVPGNYGYQDHRQSVTVGQLYVKRWLTLEGTTIGWRSDEVIAALVPRMEPTMWVRAVIGIVLCTVGTVWILQGTKVIQGSGMSGQGKWAAIGTVAVVVGLACFAWAARHHRRGTTESS